MHVALEKARKAAGISGLKKNYPDDPKQRGCGYWAAFIGSVGNDLGVMDQKLLAKEGEIADLSRRIAELEHDLGKVKDRAVKNGVEAIGQAEGWSLDKRRENIAKIAG